MRAVVFHGIGDIRLQTVPDPEIEEPTDAIVRITTSAICGTDLHFVRGTLDDVERGTILGHEGVGIVEELGPMVRNLKVGDRVVIPSTIACGSCVYCRAGYHAQCDNANPNGKRAGTAFFGGPKSSGPFHGLQAERARIPFANAGLVKLPPELTDDQAILMSDIFPTGWFAADLAEVGAGDTVAVFGCGPVGQFAIASAKLKGASRVIAVDCKSDRLDMAQEQGAEIVNFDQEDPVKTIVDLTHGIGVDRAIDAVGVDVEHAHHGPAAEQAQRKEKQFQQEVAQVAPKAKPKGEQWRPGDAPSQVLQWSADCLAKAGTLGIVGVYPPAQTSFPIGLAMNKNLAVNMGNCHHRRYIPKLIKLTLSGAAKPETILTKTAPMGSVIGAYRAFDRRDAGWIKVALDALRE
jgi:threonine dehydrogenase-like Zn-dependent dehydrogenase